MQPADPSGRAAARADGLDLVQGWTVAVAVGAIGLTGVLALAAAGSFHGRTLSGAPATTGTQDTSGSADGSGSIAPQTPSDSTFGQVTQAPVVVSGGS